MTRWTCHLADDGSCDDSIQVIWDTVRGDRRFHISQNSCRLFQLGTYRRLLADTSFDPEDIIVCVDADDWLPDPEVFQRVLDAYQDQRTWITYGSYICSNGEMVFNAPLKFAEDIRKVEWRTSHLRTWKLWLWYRINRDDFLDRNGSPLRCAGDFACMMPMIEMAGNDHSKWLADVNYVYNRHNPLSCGKIRRAEQTANGEWIRSKQPYMPITNR